MTNRTLGRLERVDLRGIWATEASDFTPWLAREENLEVLSETLGMELELEAQEKAVGPFRADILCKDSGSDAWVLIENQLERTDHSHLGQLLTYASGLEAVTIIWIAARFNEEHRSTLDWLNKITDEEFRFFGLEVELWRIEDSPAAPKFNVVSKPNDWSRSVAQAARAIDEAELSETRLVQRAYWSAFSTVLGKAGGPVSGNRKPQARASMGYPIGRSHINLNVAMTKSKRQIRSELYLRGSSAKAFFHLLAEQRETIEQEFGYPLEWKEFPNRQDSRITAYLNDVDPEDEQDWPRQHQWLVTRLNDLHRVFAHRIRELDADDWQPDGGPDEVTPSTSSPDPGS
ncbi:MAG: DUF4268 domain-containing protein [Truepera sp.]|nr:DUF4268 domain-containing protein [Truepera sp.]